MIKKTVPPIFCKEEDLILQCILERLRVDQIADRLHCSYPTAQRRRSKVIEKMGLLATNHAQQLKNDFFTKFSLEKEQAKLALLEIWMKKRQTVDLYGKTLEEFEYNANQRLAAMNTWIGLVRTEVEVLSRFGVIEATRSQVQLAVDDRERKPMWQILKEIKEKVENEKQP